MLPHLDAAYNLARWLARNAQDAEDIVQEAYLRAFKFFGNYRGGDARSWVLKIVRNTSYSFLEKNRPAELAVEFDETIHTDGTELDRTRKRRYYNPPIADASGGAGKIARELS